MPAPELDPFAGAAVMLRALRDKQVSAVELLDAHLRRIEHLNPALNAIVTLDIETARARAAETDAARARGEDGALLGLPLTIKDCIYVKGLPTTGGVPDRATILDADDSCLAARVRAAGAVIMGKTNVPPYAGDWQSANPLFGCTNNPWDPARTPGGSSGGAAAALAAGLTPLEFGGDFGGSIRIPAAFCGVYGHKTSETAVARSGHFPGANLPNSALAMSVQGPLARTAEDLELAFDVISGPDFGEDVAWRLEIPPARHQRLADFRVAILPPLAWLPVDHEITAALEGLAGTLSRAGARVHEAMPEGFGDLRQYYKLFQSIMAAIVHAGFPERRRQELAAKVRAGGDDLGNAWANGIVASAADYIGWFARREAYRAAYRDFFKQWDVLLAPVTMVNAFPHNDDLPMGARTLAVNGSPVSYSLIPAYAGLCNLSGQPGTAFPAGRTGGGLPIGLQAIGPYLEDRTSIRFAALVAQEIGGFQPPPGYDARKLDRDPT
ncbi:MAG TPA: amidase [Chloroflexota bacterium]|nr:amidase [Chloroflexota bacterium]